MKRQGHITGFYLETLMLIVVFLSIILVLTQVFGLAQQQSAKAKQLTGAVVLAGNAAEAVSASGTAEELLTLLNENGNAAMMQDTAGVTALYGEDLAPEAAGSYRVDVTWLPEATETGTMIRSVVEVRRGAAEGPVYRLETASFRPEAKA